MIAKVIERSEGRVVVAFEAETPAEGMMMGLVATDQVPQALSVSVNSYPGSPDKPPQASVYFGSFSLKTVEMIQGR